MYAPYQKQPFEIDPAWKKDYQAKNGLKYWPSPVLLKKAQEVDGVDGPVVRLASKMRLALKNAGGVGLAAPQINVSKRVILIAPRNSESVVLINPVIIEKSKEKHWDQESCLSLPGVYGDVERHDSITVRYLCMDGSQMTEELSGYTARIVQHEIDHLDGILIIDRMSSYSWSRK